MDVSRLNLAVLQYCSVKPPSRKIGNVKILMILSKLCIGIDDTKFEQSMTLFSIDKGFYLGKTQRL